MNKKDLRTIIINKIVGSIPPHIKPVNFLSETLDIGKESAYRRLRGEMSFTIEELTLLAQKLDFSLDKLIWQNRDSNEVVIDLPVYDDPRQTFLDRLKKYRQEVDIRLQYENSETIMALNYLPAEFSFHYKDIFKFSCYTWLHRKNKSSSKLRYSDVEISPELEELREEIARDSRKIRNNTYILDSNVFLSPLKEVAYFYKLGLINDEEIMRIKKDYHDLIDYVEKMVRFGGEGSDYFYLSNINIDVNSSYNNWNGNIMSSFNFHFFNKIIITNPIRCNALHEWMESLKKYSILITESNEIAQAEYFEKQRGYIELL
ncbi:hypothetical protein [Dysgonomonas sp. 25]|uniref:hypothetical protein n=1 Tax=Dysgonomonas sp. 25 TaxID=2302933 RepID=UPI0013D54422|nr:hypothetical protein [Dysgonomonas sp. 25]NDV69451.1 hypothetical protein [Dysgonomonas sp. 25]